MIEDKEYLAKGKRGLTYRATYQGKTVVVKERNPNSDAISTLENEFNFLKILNKEGIGPEVFELSDGKLVMEYVSGEQIIPWMQNRNKDEILEMLSKVFIQLRKMDEILINKEEMTNPYKHIIILNGNPKMIDFERCRKTPTPQNITQFCQFLISKRIELLFQEKGLLIDKEELVLKAKAYKESYSDKDYQKLLRVIGIG